MGRPLRQAVGNVIYHVINRSNGRFKIFRKDEDYAAFERVLEESHKKHPIRILAYCLMPNHWHLLLKPYKDGDLSLFMRSLTLTHTQRWHAHYHRVGYGHLYQGRFKSFPVEEDEYFLQLIRYIESNPLRAKLVKKAQDWQWSSLWRRLKGDKDQKALLSPWPITPPGNYAILLNKIQAEKDITRIRLSINKGSPLGKDKWVIQTAKELGLDSTLRGKGRPKNNEKST